MTVPGATPGDAGPGTARPSGPRAPRPEPPSRLEPLVFLALAAHGAAVLALTDDAARWAKPAAAAVAVTAAAALAGLAGCRSRAWRMSRAVLGTVLGGALQLLPDAGDYFLLWSFVLVATYPLFLPVRAGWALTAAIPGTFLVVAAATSTDPLPIDLLRACSLALLGATVTATTAALRSSVDAYVAVARARDESDALVRSLVRAAPVGLAYWDTQLRYQLLNDQLATMTGLTREQHIGRTIAQVTPAFRWLQPLLAAVLETGEPHLDVPITGATPARPDTEQHWSTSLFPVTLGEEMLGVGAVVLDVTDEHRANRDLAHAATHDSLTQLPNRALLVDRLTMALDQLARTGGTVALLFLDLDRFKTVNDALGHQAGDAMLQQVATRLSDAVRPGDTVARFGGDEFAVLCPDLAAPEAATVVASRILAALRAPLTLDGRPVHCSASIGVAVERDGSLGAEALLLAADIAMYRAKDSGKDMAVHYDRQLQVQVVRRLDVEHGLRVATAATGLALAYQPIVPLGEGAGPLTLEALARWQVPTDLTGAATPDAAEAPPGAPAGAARGRLGPLEHVSPDEFIGVAEDTGLIVPLGRQTLARACRDAARWRAEHGRPAQVAVNLSARELAQADLVDAINAVLTATPLPPSALQLEITESVLMADVQRSSRVLHALRELGVSIAVDDFGTGYSSLAYLRDFPIDVLKIDRSFVSRLPDDTGLVSVVLALARTIGVECVAEGVETQAQLVALGRLGCERVQGFLLSRPLAADQVSGYLAEDLSGRAAPARTAR